MLLRHSWTPDLRMNIIETSSPLCIIYVSQPFAIGPPFYTPEKVDTHWGLWGNTHYLFCLRSESCKVYSFLLIKIESCNLIFFSVRCRELHSSTPFIPNWESSWHCAFDTDFEIFMCIRGSTCKRIFSKIILQHPKCNFKIFFEYHHVLYIFCANVFRHSIWNGGEYQVSIVVTCRYMDLKFWRGWDLRCYAFHCGVSCGFKKPQHELFSLCFT